MLVSGPCSILLGVIVINVARDFLVSVVYFVLFLLRRMQQKDIVPEAEIQREILFFSENQTYSKNGITRELYFKFMEDGKIYVLSYMITYLIKFILIGKSSTLYALQT